MDFITALISCKNNQYVVCNQKDYQLNNKTIGKIKNKNLNTQSIAAIAQEIWNDLDTKGKKDKFLPFSQALQNYSKRVSQSKTGCAKLLETLGFKSSAEKTIDRLALEAAKPRVNSFIKPGFVGESLDDFRKRSEKEQREIIEALGIEKFVDSYGGFEGFIDRIKSTPPALLKNVYLFRDNTRLVGYALMNDDELTSFTIEKLPRTIDLKEIDMLKSRFAKISLSSDQPPVPKQLSTLSLIRLSSSNLSNDQIHALIREHGEAIINFLSENQVSCLISNLNIRLLSRKLYDHLFYFPEDGVITNRAEQLSISQLTEIMEKFDGMLRKFLSIRKLTEYLGQLKADQLTKNLYWKLFDLDPEMNKFRFHLLSHAQVAILMQRFPQARDLLSANQFIYYFGNLKADQVVNRDMFTALFDRDKDVLNKSRFQMLSDVEAFALMQKFKAEPRGLLSETQEQYYFANLKVSQVDNDLYSALFYRSEDSINKRRFQLLSNEEAFAFMQKFKAEPRRLLSAAQEKYYFGNLKASQVDKEMYSALFYRDDDVLNKPRFQFISDEEAFALMQKFKAEPRGLLSETQEKYYFGNLKASQVDKAMYSALFYRDDDSINKRRFQLLSNVEAFALMQKFQAEPRRLLSAAQERHYFANLKADQVDKRMFNNLFYLDDDVLNKPRFQFISDEEAFAFMQKFKAEPRRLLSQTQAEYYFANLKADQVDENMFNKLFYNDADRINKHRFQLVSIEEAFALMQKFKSEPKQHLSQAQRDYCVQQGLAL